MMVKKDIKIYIAGHKGMVGSAVWRVLEKKGYSNLLGKTSSELDLRNQKDVYDFVSMEMPDVIIDAAARVGGILANNTYPYEFLMDNMLIQNNLIKTAHELNIKKFIFLGSSCVYPKHAPQPLKEEYLLTGPLENTNQWYAIAKISGIKLIDALRQQFGRDYVSIMPTNLYGPNDNYDLNSSHVLPALIRKFHDAKEKDNTNVKLWGTGKPKREFLFVNDLAKAVMFILENRTEHSLYNVGSEFEISIKNLAEIIKKVIDFRGEIIWDSSKPDGTPRKIVDATKIKKMGWKNDTELVEGIKKTYSYFLSNINNIKEIKL
jgi:GDP-L-fucose synthase